MTSGTVTVKQNGKALVYLYSHMDSYPKGLGKDLAKFISHGVFVNGIGLDKPGQTQFNGAGCFAAALVKKLKRGPGDVYLAPQFWSEKFDYTIDIQERPRKKSVVTLSAKEGDRLLFKGKAADFLKWLKTPAAKEF